MEADIAQRVFLHEAQKRGDPVDVDLAPDEPPAGVRPSLCREMLAGAEPDLQRDPINRRLKQRRHARRRRLVRVDPQAGQQGLHERLFAGAQAVAFSSSVGAKRVRLVLAGHDLPYRATAPGLVCLQSEIGIGGYGVSLCLSFSAHDLSENGFPLFRSCSSLS